MPSYRLVILGFIINSVAITVILTPEKINKLSRLFTNVLLNPCMLIHDLVRVIGKMTLCFPALPCSHLYYHPLEWYKNTALAECQSYEGKITLQDGELQCIHWWLQNIPSDVDMFISWPNNKCKRYFSYCPDPFCIGINAFCTSWSDNKMYIFFTIYFKFPCVGQVRSRWTNSSGQCTHLGESAVVQPPVVPYSKASHSKHRGNHKARPGTITRRSKQGAGKHKHRRSQAGQSKCKSSHTSWKQRSTSKSCSNFLWGTFTNISPLGFWGTTGELQEGETTFCHGYRESSRILRDLGDSTIDHLLHQFKYQTWVTYSVDVNWWFDYCAAYNIHKFSPEEDELRNFLKGLFSFWTLNGMTMGSYTCALIHLFDDRTQKYINS